MPTKSNEKPVYVSVITLVVQRHLRQWNNVDKQLSPSCKGWREYSMQRNLRTREIKKTEQGNTSNGTKLHSIARYVGPCVHVSNVLEDSLHVV